MVHWLYARELQNILPVLSYASHIFSTEETVKKDEVTSHSYSIIM